LINAPRHWAAPTPPASQARSASAQLDNPEACHCELMTGTGPEVFTGSVAKQEPR